MAYTEYQWRSQDGLPIFARSWTPDAGPARAVVCLLHGLGEHSGRWMHVGDALSAAGYAVLASDLRGHGKSGGARGHAPSYDALLDNVTLLLEQGRALATVPLFLYGHSMGGNLALNYVLRRRPVLTGVIVTGPWLELAMRVPAWTTALGKLLRGVAPGFSLANGLNTADLAHDPDVARRYVADPLVHDRISARMGMDLLDAGAWALAHANELTLPVLIMHGLDDRITSAEASRRFAAQALGECTFRGWDGLCHEIHNEPEQAEVLGSVIAWLDAHCEPTAVTASP